MRFALLMAVVLALRAVFAPTLSLAPLGVLASPACEVAAGTAEGAGVGETSDETCCDGACVCCISAPPKEAPAEPMTPGSVDGPLRGLLVTADVGQPVEPGLAIVTPRVVWPREWDTALRERPVARAAAAVYCVWRT